MESMLYHNKMFQSCALYILQAPLFREICLAMALIYYHILRPFLYATGADTSDGFKQLTHTELMEFYPALIADLKLLAGNIINSTCSRFFLNIYSYTLLVS